MVVALASRLIAAWFAFLLPAYASFKVLARRPASEHDLQRALTYWVVIGALMAVETTTEWLVSWFPFYWELKTLFLLFLCLPQTQGSTYVYTSYLEPFFMRNQAEFDQGIVAVQNNAIAFIQVQLGALWALITRQTATQSGSSSQTDAAPNQWSQLAWVSATARQALQTSGLGNLFPVNRERPTASRNLSSESTKSNASGSSGPASGPAFPVPEHS